MHSSLLWQQQESGRQVGSFAAQAPAAVAGTAASSAQAPIVHNYGTGSKHRAVAVIAVMCALVCLHTVWAHGLGSSLFLVAFWSVACPADEALAAATAAEQLGSQAAPAAAAASKGRGGGGGSKSRRKG